MLEAIHKKTFEATKNASQSGYHASLIWSRFENPENEDWVCCPICQKSVVPVKYHFRKINKDTLSEREIAVISYFRIKNGETGGCATGESDEHKNAKILIACLIENKKVFLKIGDAIIPYSALNIKSVPTIPFRWEISKGNRRADILFQFSEWHQLLGQGIVFEIQTYILPDEEKQKREIDWICKGYSLSWIPIELFQDYGITTDEIIIDNPWAIKLAKINMDLTSYTKNLLFELINEKQKYEERRVKTCRTCIKSGTDKENPELLVCWHGTTWDKDLGTRTSRRYPTRHEPLDTCLNHKSKSW